MSVIGCDIPVNVVGSDQLTGKAGVWVKTNFREEGDYLFATTYLVAAGEPLVFELKVDLRPLEAIATKVHERLHAKMTGTTVGFSFSKAFRSIKKTAKKIGHSKLVKAVGKVGKAIIKSKITGVIAGALAVFPLTAAIGAPALAALAAANVAIKAIENGKKLVKTAVDTKKLLIDGASAVKAMVTTKAKVTTVAKAAVAKKTAAGKQQAQQIATAFKKAEAKVAPAIAKAAAVQKRLADPKVRAQMLAIQKKAESARKTLEEVQTTAKFGTGEAKLDALKSAAIVNLTAKNNVRLQAVAERNAGGLPSMLIDSKGRITMGRYNVVPIAAGGRGDVLYLGPGKQQTGRFARVSGVPGIGVDPGEIQGIAGAMGHDIIGRSRTRIGDDAYFEGEDDPTIMTLSERLAWENEPDVSGPGQSPSKHFTFLRLPNGSYLRMRRETAVRYMALPPTVQRRFIHKAIRARIGRRSIGVSMPPPSPRDKRSRDVVIRQFLQNQRDQNTRIRGEIPGETIGACIPIPNAKRNIRISGPLSVNLNSIGCECGTQF